MKSQRSSPTKEAEELEEILKNLLSVDNGDPWTRVEIIREAKAAINSKYISKQRVREAIGDKEPRPELPEGTSPTYHRYRYTVGYYAGRNQLRAELKQELELE